MSELRIKVQHHRQWARKDGGLYPVPEKVMDTRTYEGGYRITHLAGIRPGTTSEPGTAHERTDQK